MRGSTAVVSTLIGALLVAACSGSAFVSGGAGEGDAALKGGENGGASANSGGVAGGAKGGTGAFVPGGSTGSGGRVGGGGSGTGGGVVSAGGGGSASVDASMPDAGPTACNSSSDCPAPGSVCQTAACLGHQCGFVAAPSATPPGNVPGDCSKIVCATNGSETILVDPSDTDDGNECTVDSCQGGVASHKPSVGAHCQNGTKFCDAVGVCVECISDNQCPGGSTECTKATCIQGTCKVPAAGTLCNNNLDQCDGGGNCVDCVDNGGCADCCFCLSNICVQA